MSAEELAVEPPAAARRLLGATLWSGPVAVRIVEVEAYGGDPAGPWHDPAAPTRPRPAPRKCRLLGPPGGGGGAGGGRPSCPPPHPHIHGPPPPPPPGGGPDPSSRPYS
ncbi:DNA-3-methyladenine glycosylase, partial [Nocardia wallacei]|uniref:DNA-3-methyladenine glycosylase n=1 Tax=Nocardia wallacei TaxID=480035 RepID=UPI003CC7ED90